MATQSERDMMHGFNMLGLVRKNRRSIEKLPDAYAKVLLHRNYPKLKWTYIDSDDKGQIIAK